MTLREPPASIEAEQSLLSCALLDGADTLAKCLDAGIKPASFYSQANRDVYDVMLGLYANGHSLDLTLLFEELKKTDKLNAVGGMAYLTQMSGRVPTTAQLPYFIERVFDLAQRRELIRVASHAVELCYDTDGKVGDQLGKPVNDMLTLVAGAEMHHEPEWKDVCDEAAKIAQSVIDHKGKPAHMTIKWPWREMDERFGSMERSQLVIVGARPSIGKSSLLRPIAISCAEQGYPVYYVTLEVNPTQVPLQLAAMKSRIGIRQLPSAHVKDQGDFMKAVRDLRGLGITITRRDRSLAKIVGRARAMSSKRKLGMVVVDYLGLIDDISMAASKEKVATIGMVTKAFKRLAVEEGLVVVLAAQLNRLSAYDGNREPKLSDLRDSGEIEADADSVVLIHRPTEDPNGQPQPETNDVVSQPRFFQRILLAKGRDSGTSHLDVLFDRATVSFTPIAGGRH